jgi:hypothetical protein
MGASAGSRNDQAIFQGAGGDNKKTGPSGQGQFLAW